MQINIPLFQVIFSVIQIEFLRIKINLPFAQIDLRKLLSRKLIFSIRKLIYISGNMICTIGKLAHEFGNLTCYIEKCIDVSEVLICIKRKLIYLSGIPICISGKVIYICGNFNCKRYAAMNF